MTTIGEKTPVDEESRSWAFANYLEPMRRITVTREGQSHEFGILAPSAEVSVALGRVGGVTAADSKPTLDQAWAMKRRAIIAALVNVNSRLPVFTERDQPFLMANLRAGNWLDHLGDACLASLGGIDEPGTLRCPKCKSALEAGWKFCPACGNAYVEDEESEEAREKNS